MKNFLFIFLLVLALGIGFVAGQIWAPQRVEKGQDFESQQKTNQSVSEKVESKGSPERISQGSQNRTRRTADISRAPLITNQDDSTEPPPPPHEDMDFPQGPEKILDPEQLFPQGVFPTPEEMEEEHMRSLWESGASLEEIQLMQRQFEEEKENLKERLAAKPFEAPPPPDEAMREQAGKEQD